MNKQSLAKLQQAVDGAGHILIIQPENPDGDSLGSSLALEEIFSAMDKEVSMYCPVQMPTYLRYYSGWDRVSEDLPDGFDLSILVDASSLALVERVFTPANTARLKDKPLFILDHHDVDVDIPVDTILIGDLAVVSTGELIFNLANQLDWPLNKTSAEFLVQSILADSLGLTTPTP
jgi:nanoRNase/pAp phosphatase (c-di-AMP/oligoRNAs hydrolase)